MPMNRAVLVIDVGTSKAHAAVVNIDDGRLAASAFAPIGWVHPVPGWTEAVPEDLFCAVKRAVAGAVNGLDARENVLVCVACSFQGDAFCPLDDDGIPLYNFILAMDRRGEECLDQLRRGIGADRFEEILGCPFSAREPAKYLWMRNMYPERMRRARHIVNVQQYVLMRLGLGLRQDVTLASHKVMLDVKTGNWSQELCEAIGLTPEQLGDPHMLSGTVVGTLRAIGETVFSKELPVILGGHDCALGMLGLGALPGYGGIVANVAGTTEHIGFFNECYTQISQFTLTSYRGPLAQSFVPLGAESAGGPLRWAVETFARDTQDYRTLFARLPFDADGTLFCVNHAVGVGVGGFVGIPKRSEDYIASLVEAITFRLAEKYHALNMYSGGFSRMRAGGGGALLREWLALKAAVFNIPVETVANNEVSSVGAAILAGVCLGIYADVAEAQSAMIQTVDCVEPNPVLANRYAEVYTRWERARALSATNQFE